MVCLCTYTCEVPEQWVILAKVLDYVGSWSTLNEVSRQIKMNNC